jgi:P-type Ca2+ transporter type 2C
LTLAIILPFLQRFFGTVALAPAELIAILAVSTTPFWAIEIEKWILRRKT